MSYICCLLYSALLFPPVSLFADEMSKAGVRNQIPARSRHVFDEADRHYSNREFSRAFATLDILTQREPGSYPVQIHCAELHLYHGNYAKAIKFAELALFANPKSTNARFVRGCANFQSSNFRNAIRDINACIVGNSSNPNLYKLRAECFRKIDEQGVAAADLMLAYKLDRDPNTLYVAGECHCEMRNFNAALKLYDQLIQSHPDYPRGHLGRGFVLLMQNQVKEANKSFEKAVSMDSSLSDAVDQIISWHRANGFR